MALTGLGAFVFLIFHLGGNLLSLKGPAAYNEYARRLHSIPGLPLIEAALGALFLIHIAYGIVISLLNASARPIPYVLKKSAEPRTAPANSMIFTGLIIFAYMAYHVYTMAYGPRSVVPVYQHVSEAFHDPWIAVIYLVGLGALAWHLLYGLFSALTTLGLRHPRHDAWLNVACVAGALLITLGFILIVIWFWAGFGGAS